MVSIVTGPEYRAFLKAGKKRLQFGGKNVEDMTRGELLDAVYAYHHALLKEKNSQPVNPLASVLDTFFNGRPAR